MNAILFLIYNLQALLVEGNFKITSGELNGNKSGIVIIQDDHLAVKVIAEGEQIFSEISPSRKPFDWYDLPVVKKLLYPDFDIGFMEKADQSTFIITNLSKLKKLFSTALNDTIPQLEDIKLEMLRKRGW